VEGGADALSAINTLGGPNPELSSQFVGLSGAAIFPVTVYSIARLRRVISVPIIAMGGIRGAADIRVLEAIDPNLFYAIGTALGGLTSEEIREYFEILETDLAQGTDRATGMTLKAAERRGHRWAVRVLQGGKHRFQAFLGGGQPGPPRAPRAGCGPHDP